MLTVYWCAVRNQVDYNQNVDEYQGMFFLMGFRAGQDSKESIEMLTRQVSGEQAVVFTHVVAASFHWRK